MRGKKIAVLGIVLLLRIAAIAGTTCSPTSNPTTGPTVTPTDGTTLEFDYVGPGPGTSNFYEFNVTAGRSYSIQVTQPYDAIPTTDLTAEINNEASFTTQCSGSATLTITSNDTTAMEPILRTSGGASVVPFRHSVLPSAAGTMILQVQNSGSNLHYINVSVTETTLYTSQWSTYAAFQVNFTLIYTGNSSITGTLNATSNTNSYTKSGISLSSSARQVNFVGSTDLNIPANTAGTATFIHNGPPAAMIGDMNMINGNYASCCILQGKFEPVKQGHH